MLHYVTLGSNDIPRSKKFYDAALAPLGHVCLVNSEDEVGYGHPTEKQDARECRLWILKPLLKLPANWGNGTMIALTAESRVAVDKFYEAAMKSGGIDEGGPGLRPYNANFYSCYVRDPDGNKLSAVCEKAE
jgi:catechol 2,3-dioxygenase-like lactoylglutathione lyase family enzyme